MDAVYEIDKLGCASCAAKMEEKIKKMDEVDDAVVNFSSSKLYLKTKDKADQALLEEIDGIISSVESQASLVYDQGTSRDQAEDAGVAERRFSLLKLILPIVLFLASFLVDELNIKSGMLVLAYVIAGADVIMAALENISRGQIFDENFLMTVASVGAIFIGEVSEAVAVMVFYSLGEFFQDLAVDRSRKSIASLMDIKADYANLIQNHRLVQVDPEDLEIGDEIIIKPGDKVPVDGLVIDGSSSLDSSAMTGESMPLEVQEGDRILSGSINESGALKMRVESKYEDSAVATILALVEESGAKKAPTEKFITRFARVYTPIVCLVALLVGLGVPLVTGGDFSTWIYRALVFLVASCPCALVISVPLSFFAGIGRLSKDGIIAKGANHLEDASKIGLIAFDKTGTLTEGEFELAQVKPAPGVSQDELLELAAIAEGMSDHPIAQSIKEAYQGQPVQADSLDNVPGHGIIASLDGKKIYAGNARLMDKYGIDYLPVEEPGTVVYIGVDQSYYGSLLIQDRVKEEAGQIIAKLQEQGLDTVMLTGDNELVAKQVAGQLGLDDYQAGLLPQDKVRLVEEKMDKKEGKLAFVGDGINDAPAMVTADVGIAMGQMGSDAAIEAADIVIMEDRLQALPKLVHISKRTMSIVRQNIILSLGIKLVVLALALFGQASMWMAVFADVGVALLAIFNAMRLLGIQSE